MLPWSCNYYQGGYKREYPYYPYDYSGKITDPHFCRNKIFT
jgi:hypothetical protein